MKYEKAKVDVHEMLKIKFDILIYVKIQKFKI